MKQYLQSRAGRILFSAALFCLIGSIRLSAGILAQELSPCVAGCAREYAVWTLYKDDCTGEIFSFLVDCDQNTYFNVPNPWCTILPFPPAFDPFPEDFRAQLANADFATPGAECGYFINNPDGTRITFHNPNAQELARAIEAYECTFGPGLIH